MPLLLSLTPLCERHDQNVAEQRGYGGSVNGVGGAVNEALWRVDAVLVRRSWGVLRADRLPQNQINKIQINNVRYFFHGLVLRKMAIEPNGAVAIALAPV